MESYKREIGRRIARMRDKQGLTQEQLSEKIGCSKNHLSGIECGKFNVTTSFLFKLCQVLGQTPDYYLLGHVSEHTDELMQLFMRLSEAEQKMAIELLKVYLEKTYGH